ncbi:hypothetical protein [Salicibibacter kimchii]|uniref:DUF1146 domain-containing protein n=1 Tax=Salicibibacter kimchii TaxID=2099786 RepID=A0A345C2E2_9BACI|nr:hypothetical protein [Salicibibacter kimchii]AXF57373.1 hypothetical protein DT065_16150 [Salicibibacter kimchii]
MVLKVITVIAVHIVIFYSQKTLIKGSNEVNLERAFYTLLAFTAVIGVLYVLDIPLPSLSQLLTRVAKQSFA